MSQVVPSQQETKSPMRWIQLLAGPVIWSVHFLASYLLVEAFCKMGWNFSILGFHALTFILVAVTLLALWMGGLFTLRSYRTWKRLNADRDVAEELRDPARWSEGPDEFLYFSGFLLSLLFTATIVVVGLPVLFLPPCL